MEAIMNRPSIFLSFANENKRFLRRLAREHEAIKESFRNGPYEIIDRFNVSLPEVINVFQNASYRNSLTVFHFGGHADDYELVLVDATVDTRNFNDFLKELPSLQLVFLNGCATRNQAKELVEQGIPNVIATDSSIPDSIAAEFAKRFYNGLIQGQSVETAFRWAVQGHASDKNGPVRGGFDLDSSQTAAVLWKHYYLNDDAKSWKLSDCLDDPYFGLPLPQKTYFPAKPFVSLQQYTRNEASVFFGRAADLQKLFGFISASRNPVLLLYGQSGIGKSSLLDAGLVPRLKSDYQVLYLKRVAGLGLNGTIAKAFRNGNDPAFDLHAEWLLVESDDKPLMIIMDQVEEVFTQPLPEEREELVLFLDKIHAVFQEVHKAPRGKLILSYRKEFHAEIETCCRALRLPITEPGFFVQALSQKGIVEVVKGLTLSQANREQYGLQVEKGLAERIADDLTEDSDAPMAPILQILLDKMWNQAPRDQNGQKWFTHELYTRNKNEGIALIDFLTHAFQEIQEWNNSAVESGLLLDLLHSLTSELGTATSRLYSEIIADYDPDLALPELIRQCKNRYLIAENKDNPNLLSLAHDTLAPVVRREFEVSRRSGQVAFRILRNLKTDLKDFPNELTLSVRDLEHVERGRQGMRTWKNEAGQDEVALIARSRKNRKAQIRQKKIQRWTKRGMVLSIIFVAFLSLGLYLREIVSSHRDRTRSIVSQATNLSKRQIATSIRLIEAALQLAPDDTYALQKFYSLADSLKKQLAFNRRIDSDKKISGVMISPDEHYILCDLGDALQVRTIEGDSILTYKLPGRIQNDDYGFLPESSCFFASVIDSLQSKTVVICNYETRDSEKITFLPIEKSGKKNGVQFDAAKKEFTLNSTGKTVIYKVGVITDFLNDHTQKIYISDKQCLHINEAKNVALMTYCLSDHSYFFADDVVFNYKFRNWDYTKKFIAFNHKGVPVINTTKIYSSAKKNVVTLDGTSMNDSLEKERLFVLFDKGKRFIYNEDNYLLLGETIRPFDKSGRWRFYRDSLYLQKKEHILIIRKPNFIESFRYEFPVKQRLLAVQESKTGFIAVTSGCDITDFGSGFDANCNSLFVYTFKHSTTGIKLVKPKEEIPFEEIYPVIPWMSQKIIIDDANKRLWFAAGHYVSSVTFSGPILKNSVRLASEVITMDLSPTKDSILIRTNDSLLLFQRNFKKLVGISIAGQYEKGRRYLVNHDFSKTGEITTLYLFHFLWKYRYKTEPVEPAEFTYPYWTDSNVVDRKFPNLVVNKYGAISKWVRGEFPIPIRKTGLHVQNEIVFNDQRRFFMEKSSPFYYPLPSAISEWVDQMKIPPLSKQQIREYGLDEQPWKTYVYTCIGWLFEEKKDPNRF